MQRGIFSWNSQPTVEEAHRKLDKKHVAHNPQMGDAEKSLTPTHLWGQLPIKIKCEYTDFFTQWSWRIQTAIWYANVSFMAWPNKPLQLLRHEEDLFTFVLILEFTSNKKGQLL